MTDELYVHRRRIAWWDTDAANIAYTGRFPQFGMEAIDGWFIDRLGTDWYRLHNDLGGGTPFVHLSMDMRSPLTPRDELLTTVRLAKAGRSSLEFRVEGRVAADGRLSFEGKFVCVFVNGKTGKATSIPPQFRAAVAHEAALAAAK